MVIAEDHAIAGTEAGVLVYARLVDCTNPLDFAGTVARHTDLGDSQFEVPTKLALALDRAVVLLEGVVGESVDMSVTGGKLRLEAHAEGRGNLKDFIDVPPEVPSMALRVDPVLVKRGLANATDMAVTEDAVVLLGADEYVYLVSPSGG